ncbi:class IIb bacteriocin, lactobin A/cerein 7B family [Litorilituus lipolyticus]|uniref:Class IIb bacteriocin, lactobin A/cerein 7B family n=2 Tax=Litorilituus lipolyticus TaxID=2491017 RepID=A0A502L3U7_9GAMM|nr:class IIb bacteriocin, lactobin A/cerein 7B family [Litorilituus lipolyticus]
MEYNRMRELNVNEIEQVNGGVGSLVILGVVGARAIYTAYRTNAAFRSSVNKAAQWVASSIAGGYFYEKAAEMAAGEAGVN